MKPYYYCYSHPQKDFLIKNGVFCIVKGIHPKTNKTYWVFQRSEKLNNLLTQWQSSKK